MSARLDLVVVGASFAGLACAESAARRGARVVVVERRRAPGEAVGTTGLLTREAAEALRPPPSVLGARIDVIELGFGTRSGVLRREGAGFLATDTGALLRSLAERAAGAGASLRFGARAELADAHRGVVRAGGELLRADRVIAADGARSRVAQRAGIARSARFLRGAERHVELEQGGLDAGACLLALDPRLAPGYAAWCVRGVHAWQVGVLGGGPAWRADRALDAWLARLVAERGAVVRRVAETRAGVVPVGAVSAPWAGRVIAVGDAAGHVSALTAGGIGRAALAGHAVGSTLGLDGEPWRASLVALGRSCGGWRLAAARALHAALAISPAPLALALRVPPLAAAACELAFRQSRRASVRGLQALQ